MWESAMQTIDTLIEFDGNNFSYFKYKGFIYEKIGAHDSALICFRKSLSILDIKNTERTTNDLIEELILVYLIDGKERFLVESAKYLDKQRVIMLRNEMSECLNVLDLVDRVYPFAKPVNINALNQ